MEDLAKRRERYPVAHHVFDDRRSPTVSEAVGVLPDAIGPVQLLVHEPGRWLPTCDARLLAQRNPEQAEPVVDQDPFSHRDRLRREYPEAEFGWHDALQVGRVSEKGEHLLARQPHAHGRLENVERHASHSSRSVAILGRCVGRGWPERHIGVLSKIARQWLWRGVFDATPRYFSAASRTPPPSSWPTELR